MPVTLLSRSESREFEAPVPVRVPGGTVQERRFTVFPAGAEMNRTLTTGLIMDRVR